MNREVIFKLLNEYQEMLKSRTGSPHNELVDLIRQFANEKYPL